MEEKLFQFLINGLPVKARYTQNTIENILIPLLEKLTLLQNKKQKRLVVFLAAPAAAGKSTLAHFLSDLSHTTEGITPIQSVGLDGFHFHQDEIEVKTVWKDGIEIPMSKVKGAPETYNVEKFLCKLKQLEQTKVKWPVYDRRIHDVVEDAVDVTEKIVLIEGNWLLSNEKIWTGIFSFCDFSIFISADELYLKDRLICRKQNGGMSFEKAALFYQNSDRLNISRAMKYRFRADLELKMTQDGDYKLL